MLENKERFNEEAIDGAKKVFLETGFKPQEKK
jgi:hypothetical protein